MDLRPYTVHDAETNRIMTLINYSLYVMLLMPLITVADKESDKFSSNDALKLVTAIEQIKAYYIDKKNYHTVVDSAIEGMVNQLDDYSEYLDSSALELIQTRNQGQYVGIGAELQPHKDGLEVISSFENSPSERSGIQPGDIITHLNQHTLKDKSFSKSLMTFQGKPFTTVKITVYRPSSNKTYDFTLRRESLTPFIPSYHILHDNIAYIKIPYFTEKTNQDVEKMMVKINNSDIIGLIIDLRGNPGGLLDSAVKTADLFLDSESLRKNKIIVSTKSRHELMYLTALATPGDVFNNKPIIVLINKGSASSAEIVASALKDHQRAYILGQKSFGKGSIQNIISLNKNSAIKITTGLYKTPKGHIIQGVGISPDKTIHTETNKRIPLLQDPYILESITLLNGNKLL